MIPHKHLTTGSMAFVVVVVGGLAGNWLKCLQPAFAASPKAVEFFVSPQGNDGWSGRVAAPTAGDGPFATIGRARDAVRAWRNTQAQPARVRVVLRGGNYYLDQPLEFGPQDSASKDAPIIYAAADGEKVVLSGGRRLVGGRWDEVNGRKAWILDIPEVKAGKWNFHQLFINGERRPRTRLPKEGFYHVESVPEYDAKQPDDDQHNNVRRFVYSGTDIQLWHNLEDVDLVAVETCQSNRLPIQKLDVERRLVTFDRTSRGNLRFRHINGAVVIVSSARSSRGLQNTLAMLRRIASAGDAA